MQHGSQPGALGDRDHARRLVQERLDAADQPEPDVRDAHGDPQPPRVVAWEAQREQPPRVARRGADQLLRVGVAADDLVHHDDVGGVNESLLLGEVAVEPLDSLLHARLPRKRPGLFVVAVRELDDRRALDAVLQELELDRADTAAHFQRRPRHTACRQLVDEPLGGVVEPALAIAPRVAAGEPRPEEPLVPGRAAPAHRVESRRGSAEAVRPPRWPRTPSTVGTSPRPAA